MIMLAFLDVLIKNRPGKFENSSDRLILKAPCFSVDLFPIRIVEIPVSVVSTRIVVLGECSSYEGNTMPEYVSDQANHVQE